MKETDAALLRNREFAARFSGYELSGVPAKSLAVLACMDCRMQIEPMLGLSPGDAHILRNAGATATEDAARSLMVSVHRMGVQEIMIIAHTQCGMMTFTDAEFREDLIARHGGSEGIPSQFHAFTDLDEHVRDQVRALRTNALFPYTVSVRGFVYDVNDRTLREVDTN